MPSTAQAPMERRDNGLAHSAALLARPDQVLSSSRTSSLRVMALRPGSRLGAGHLARPGRFSERGEGGAFLAAPWFAHSDLLYQA